MLEPTTTRWAMIKATTIAGWKDVCMLRTWQKWLFITIVAILTTIGLD